MFISTPCMGELVPAEPPNNPPNTLPRRLICFLHPSKWNATAARSFLLRWRPHRFVRLCEGLVSDPSDDQALGSGSFASLAVSSETAEKMAEVKEELDQAGEALERE